mgnify:CR=1 FL=1
MPKSKSSKINLNYGVYMGILTKDDTRFSGKSVRFFFWFNQGVSIEKLRFSRFNRKYAGGFIGFRLNRRTGCLSLTLTDFLLRPFLKNLAPVLYPIFLGPTSTLSVLRSPNSTYYKNATWQTKLLILKKKIGLYVGCVPIFFIK